MGESTLTDDAMKLSIDSDDGNTVNMKVAGSVTQQEIALLADPVCDLLGPEAYRRPDGVAVRVMDGR